MRAPIYTPTFTPVEAYHVRFSASGGPTLGSTIGRVLTAGGADIDHMNSVRTAIQSLTDDTAGRARALRDQAAMLDLVASHAGLQGGEAVASQPATLDELNRIRDEGQSALETPGMVAGYDAQISPAIDDASARITGHALNQALVERQALTEQTMQIAQRNAASDWLDPGRFAEGLGTVQSLAAVQAGPLADETDRAMAMRSAVGGTVAQAIGQALSAGEPEIAAHIVGGWGDALSPAAYQMAIARVGQAAQNQRMATVFAQAAGGNRVQDPPAAVPPANAIPPENAAIRITHPDGSDAVYGGIGLAAVAPGDLVAPRHVIGSAGPVVTLQTTTPTGESGDAAAWLHSAGGTGAMIGTIDAARGWDMPTMLDRIAARQDLSQEDRALAASFGQRRMASDTAQLAENDLAAGRNVVTLIAAKPVAFAQSADLPVDLAANLTPATLANVDAALRSAGQSPSVPTLDTPTSLRLELLQRQAPAQFAQTNLASLIGTAHPDDLARLAQNQSVIVSGKSVDSTGDQRSAVLDALATHEFMTGERLPDTVLPLVSNQAATMLRLNQTDPGDRSAIGATVTDAIQNQRDQP
jgi:hypothetical protein